jgi:hypothetical protein
MMILSGMDVAVTGPNLHDRRVDFFIRCYKSLEFLYSKVDISKFNKTFIKFFGPLNNYLWRDTTAPIFQSFFFENGFETNIWQFLIHPSEFVNCFISLIIRRAICLTPPKPPAPFIASSLSNANLDVIDANVYGSALALGYSLCDEISQSEQMCVDVCCVFVSLLLLLFEYTLLLDYLLCDEISQSEQMCVVFFVVIIIIIVVVVV